MVKKKLSAKDIIYLIVIALLLGGLVTSSIFLIAKVHREKVQYNNQDYYDKKLIQFAMENGNYSQGQIVFIGDSITDLYHLDNYYQDLPLNTYNRGIGGDITSLLFNRLQVSLYDLHPSKVVLMIGINDINGGVSKDTIMGNYNKILNGIKTNLAAAQVNVMSILPMNADVPSGINLNKSTQMIMDINVEIEALVNQYAYQYFDLFSLVKDENNHLKKEYSLDGIHLSEEGFAAWTNLIKPSLL